jgi:hypothetical protein
MDILKGAELGRAMRAELEAERLASINAERELTELAGQLAGALRVSARFLDLEATAHRERGDAGKAEPCEAQAALNRGLVARYERAAT